jgi:hypothetical protein
MSDQLPERREPPEPREPADLRASDAEREQAVEALRHAVSEGRLDVEELDERVSAAYTVRTRSELERLVADVSTAVIGTGHGSQPVVHSGSGIVVREGPGGTRRVVSVMGGHDRSGRWRVAPHVSVINVMGGSDIDLNDAELSDRVTVLRVISVMGGSEIRVPEGIEVEVSQFALMGGNDVRLGDELPPPGGPVIRVRLISIMGGVSVRRGRKPTREERRRAKELRRDEKLRLAEELRGRKSSGRELDP